MKFLYFLLFSLPLMANEALVYNLYFEKEYDEVIDIANNMTIENELSEVKKYQITLLKAYAYCNKKDFNNAEKTLKSVKKKFEKDDGFLHLDVYIKIQNKSYKKVIKDLEELDSKNNLNHDQLISLANLYIQTGENVKARVILNKINPKEENSKAKELLGYLDYLNNSYKSSLYHYKKTISLNRSNPENYLAIEQIYGKIHRDDLAIATIEESLQQNPHNPYLLTRLGYLYENHGDYRKALSHYEKAESFHANDHYTKNAIIRLKKKLAFNSYTAYTKSNQNYINKSKLISSKKNINYNSINQSFSQYLIDDFTFGADITMNETEKNLAKNHLIKDQTYFLRAQWQRSEHFVSLSFGSAQYQSNNIGQGTDGSDQMFAGNSVYSYQSPKNNLSLAYAKSYYVQDFDTYLFNEPLETYTLQNVYLLNSQNSFLIKALSGQSQNLHYKVYSIAPIHELVDITGVRLKFFFERYLVDELDNYYQYFFSANYDVDWTDRFGHSFIIDVGRREIDDVLFQEVRWDFKYTYHKTDAFILTFNQRVEDNGNTKRKDEITSITGAFNLYF